MVDDLVGEGGGDPRVLPGADLDRGALEPAPVEGDGPQAPGGGPDRVVLIEQRQVDGSGQLGALTIEPLDLGVDAGEGGVALLPKILGAATLGPVYSSSQGVERFRWDPKEHRWASVWRRPDVSSTSMIPVHCQSFS